MDRSDALRLLASFLGIIAAVVGGFAVFIGGALQSLDSGPRIPSWVTLAAPLVVLAGAIGAAFLGPRRPRAAAGLYAGAGALLATILALLDLRRALFVLPIGLAAAAALAWWAAPPRVRGVQSTSS